MDQNSTSAEQRNRKAVYTIVERPGLEKKFWVRIGSAFVNQDQSLNVKLDAMPVNGSIHIRDLDEQELERSRQRREARENRQGDGAVALFAGAA